MIYATGDTHGNFLRFRPEYFPEQETMTKDDYVIICGDFGGIWEGEKKDRKLLDRLEKLPFTLLFVCGNHENFDRLADYPVEEWHGGKVRKIRPHVLHLMRGQVFEIEGYTFFTMGGASSHDVADGILNPFAPDFKEQYADMRMAGAQFRVNHRSWWKEELPSEEEYAEARKNLERENYEVDYIITHCAPSSIVDVVGNNRYEHDRLTDFLEEVKERARFHYWIFGHYHDDKKIQDRFILLYDQIVKVV